MITQYKPAATVRLRVPAIYEAASNKIIPIDTKVDFLPEDNCFFDLAAARTACALSLSSADRDMLESNLRAVGYDDIIYVTSRDDRGSGLYIASRTEGDTLRVIAVIKGTESDEWGSNFDVGFSAEHRGFARAADTAELSIGDYIFTRAIGTQPSFFITGYSRGGAVAGILAKRLCERYGTDSVCAYTVASPNVTISRQTARFGCVFNLIRDDDFFTRLPPEGWGYSRYGRDIRLSNTSDFNRRYRELTGEDYIGFDSSEPIDSFLCTVMKLAPNVHAYYKRRRDAGDGQMSMYEFMNHATDMMRSQSGGDTADAMISALSGDYADLLYFLSSGADIEQLLSSASGIPKSSIADSHSPAAYIAALEGYRL